MTFHVSQIPLQRLVFCDQAGNDRVKRTVKILEGQPWTPAHALSSRRRCSLLLPTPLASAISYFQAIVLGVLQGVTELFPISSLGHTVLFPTLFGWNDARQRAVPVGVLLAGLRRDLHVGSALGLLAYYWRDWVEIVAAFFRTLGKRRAETPTSGWRG